MSMKVKTRNEKRASVLRRMRESSGLTMREAAALIGVSHVAISQFENDKLNLPEFRIEQLVQAYGFKKDEFDKLMGRPQALNPRDDCRSMIERLNNDQLLAVRSVMVQMLHVPTEQSVPSAGE